MSEFKALIWTYALELPVLVGLASGWRASLGQTNLGQTNLVRVVLAGLVASGLSHPLAWHCALQMDSTRYRWGWWAIEAGVWIFEAGILGLILRWRMPQALTASLLANGVSAAVGRWL